MQTSILENKSIMVLLSISSLFSSAEARFQQIENNPL